MASDYGDLKNLHRMLNGPSKKVSTFQNYLHQRIYDGVRNVKKLFFEIKSQGYSGSYASVYRYAKAKSKTYNNYKVSPRFETKPGEQAQVDWGSFGKIEINDKIYPLYSFVYILGYSRIVYIEFTVKQNLQTFQECHIHAFEKLGTPKTILYDNIKTVVLKREKLPDKRFRHTYNPAFLNFANYYGFQIKLCIPHRPQTKGKVEAAVKHIRNNFMQGLDKSKIKSLEELNQMSKKWIDDVINIRIHGTTGEKPIIRWQREKPYLKFPADLPKYQTSSFLTRNSTKDGLVQYKSSFYSVPAKYARRKLFLKESNKGGLVFLLIYFENKIIAKHPLSSKKGDWVVNDEHFVYKSEKPSSFVSIILDKLRTVRSQENQKFVLDRPLSYYDHLIPKK